MVNKRNFGTRPDQRPELLSSLQPEKTKTLMKK